jgi:hypothetical protein
MAETTAERVLAGASGFPRQLESLTDPGPRRLATHRGPTELRRHGRILAPARRPAHPRTGLLTVKATSAVSVLPDGRCAHRHASPAT